MDALASMAGQLTGARAPAPAQEASTGKTASLRRRLRLHGQQTARELAVAAGLRDSGLVSALLKNDLHAGRVLFADSVYEWNTNYREPEVHAPEQIARAFAIADEAMYELLLSEGAPGDSPACDATIIGFCDEACQEVTSLAEASAAMREAFEWLQPRGYVELGTDGQGEFINVVRRPGEDN